MYHRGAVAGAQHLSGHRQRQVEVAAGDGEDALGKVEMRAGQRSPARTGARRGPHGHRQSVQECVSFTTELHAHDLVASPLAGFKVL